MKKNSKNGRTLSEEEKKLWKFVTRGDEPLRKNKKPSPLEGEDGKQREPGEGYLSISTPHLGLPKRLLRKPKANRPLPQGERRLKLGEYANIDANTAERFRKGNYPVDATLDLHGMTAAKAHAALMRFVGFHYKKKNRCLLIITGKGKTGEGVLKTALPGWLADDALVAMILAFDNAKAKHGGSGAFYVLLKRQR